MDRVQKVIKGFATLGRRQQLALASFVIGIGLVLALGMSAVGTADYLPVYKNLSLANSGQIDSALSAAGINTIVSEDGKSVSVPRQDLSRARMIIAEAGLPSKGDVGWELFDSKNGLTMNSFLQRVNRLRAMEGELARSIQTLVGIQSARVHLVLPQREAFSRDKPEPRASVIVRPTPGRTITRKQAVAIRNLVASSVAGLNLGRVTVLSSSGEVILAEGGSSIGQVTLQSTKTAIENRMEHEVAKILSARVGAENVRVSVNVVLSSAKETIVEQSYNPDQQVVRSTESRAEQHTGNDQKGNVGVENNIPKALAQGGGGGTRTALSKTGETVRYEIGNTRRETIRGAGEITKVATAVLLNGIFSINGPDVVYSERTPEEVKRLTALVKTAVGFDSARGDVVSVESLRFMDYSMDVGQTPVGIGLMQQITNNIGSILRGVLALLIVGLVMIFGLKPALKVITENPTAALDKPDSAHAPTLISDANSGQAALPGADGNLSGAGYSQILEPESSSPTLIETIGVQGRLLKHRVEDIQKVASERPNEALRVLRSWLAEA